MKLSELAALIGGSISGNPDVEITGVAGLNDAVQGDITYIIDNSVIDTMPDINASAVIVKNKAESLEISMLIVKNPQFVFAKALEIFYSNPYESTGVSDRAIIGSNVSFGQEVSVHELAYVGDNASIGSRVTIMPGAFIAEGVIIGNDCYIHPNVTIEKNVTIGNNVTIHSGSVIGADGFGYVLEKGEHYKIPQIGGVIIEDKVEIGANVTIDRATSKNTIIGFGTKIDNLVQIAHNVIIGKHCIILSQVGISGSVEIGNYVILAGQVGVRDHIKIGDRAIAGAKSGIGCNLPEGQVYSGSPAIPHSLWLRAQSIYSKLPDFIKRIQGLEKKLENISGRQEDE